MYKNLTDTLFIGKNIISLPKCHSTNDIAADISQSNRLFEGTVIITQEQTIGKGQRGNIWKSQPNLNLTFSVALEPKFLQIKDQFFLNIITSLAIADALSDLVKIELKIKWPNDIYSDEKKLGGILIENSVKGNVLNTAVIGIGLNINQKEFDGLPNATSVFNITDEVFDLEKVLNVVLRNIEKRYLQLKSGDFEQLRQAYLEKLYWYQEEHTFLSDSEFTGVIIGIDEYGKLLVERDNETKAFDLKEIKFVR